MLIYFRVLGESFNFAINALKNNKLRTFLSLLGVTIGIFSIIAVLAAVDSLKREVTGSLSSLDESTMIITRMSFGPTEVPMWKREQFPDVSYEEYQTIKEIPEVAAVSYSLYMGQESLRYRGKQLSNVDIFPVTYEHYEIEALQIEEGRFFNAAESNSGANVMVIGADVAESLLENENPLGKEIRLYGRDFTVIGVLEKQGSNFLGPSNDNAVIIPTNIVRKIYGDNNRSIFPQIIVKPKEGVDEDELSAKLEHHLRLQRGIKPGDVSTFFINKLSGFADFIDDITGQLNFMGLIISGFSLLVGGFGIANIMFVSVKERTHIIGIQKSLGAKNKFILFQFLFEAVILAVIGGLVGLFFVWIASVIVSGFTGDFQFVLSAGNMLIGFLISTAIGLISGIIPAISAAQLDPVEAIRTGM
ncbi:MAG TPA: ABC transporter permease [Flavobacteriaceae bacterium]|nr:ABC transporter permease [Flavobacteriaceae bacterium]